MLSSSSRFPSQEMESEDVVKDAIPDVTISVVDNKGKEKEKRVKQKVKP